MENTKNTSY